MKDEIKEILLKDFNEILVKEFCTDWKEKRLYIELLVNSTPFSNLLDYITNLQQIEQDHQKLNGELREENQRLQKENERLNNIIDELEKYLYTICIGEATFEERGITQSIIQRLKGLKEGKQ